MNKTHYDVFVIGSGIAGQTTAKMLVEKGLSVAITDIREYGGTCANRGCDPKKVLLQFADLVHYSENLKSSGVTDVPKIDWAAVQKFKSGFTDVVPMSTEKNLKKLGIKLYHQSPEFIDEQSVMVEGKPVNANYFVIASGLTPRTLEFKGNGLLLKSDDVLDLKELPKSATFLGSGYVGMEFAYLMSTLGVEVTMIDRGERPLRQFDRFLVDELTKRMTSKGVKFIANAEVLSVEKLRTNLRVVYNKEGKEQEQDSEVVINTAGRVPSIEMLGLKNAKVDFDHQGVQVNSYLQSNSNPRVYACGDVSNASLPLTPLSGLQGYIVASNILKAKSKEFQFPLVPSTVFTQPQISSVGLSEKEAKDTYKDIQVYEGKVPNWFNAKKQQEDAYAFKIIANKRTRKIVGAHLLSAEANEDINIMTTAINAGMTVDEFKRLIFTYPSYANDLKSMMKDDD